MHSHTNTLNNTIHTKSLRDSMAGAKRSLRITSVHNTTLSVYFSWLTSFQFQVASLAWTKIWFYGQNTQNKEHTVQSIDVRKILKDCSGFFFTDWLTFVYICSSFPKYLMTLGDVISEQREALTQKTDCVNHLLFVNFHRKTAQTTTVSTAVELPPKAVMDSYLYNSSALFFSKFTIFV